MADSLTKHVARARPSPSEPPVMHTCNPAKDRVLENGHGIVYACARGCSLRRELGGRKGDATSEIRTKGVWWTPSVAAFRK